MKTNKILTIGLFSLAAFVATSCKDSFLEVENPTDFPVEDYYKTKKHLEESLIAAYAPLHWFDQGTTGNYNAIHYSDFRADDLYPNGSSNSDQPSLQAMFTYADLTSLMTPTGWWSDGFSGVKRSNDCIKYADWTEEAGDITAAEKADIVSQARTLRAFYYSILWKTYGNIPCYFENLASPYISEQLTADEVYAKVITDLEDIITNGALKDEYPLSEAGHVTKPMAQMLYADMVMIQKDQSRYATALNYMKSIISSGKFGLVDDFAGIWLESGEWSKESIFEINYYCQNSPRSWSNILAAGGTVTPRLCGPRDFTPNADCDIEAGWGFAALPKHVATLFSPEDKRGPVTIFDMEANGTVTPGGGGWQYTGYMLGKYMPHKGDNVGHNGDGDVNFNNNERVYRYAETLLNAAELLLQTGGSASEAAGYVNQVRQRAGLSNLNDVTIDDIINERRLEFLGEGKRYYDLVRTGKAASVLTAANDEGGYRKADWNENYRYLPIPQSDIDATGGTMEQNGSY